MAFSIPIFSNALTCGTFLDSFIDKYPRNGSGIELQNGKRIYEGEWFLNHKEGSGVYLQDGLALYEGEWNDDKPNGKGLYIMK